MNKETIKNNRAIRYLYYTVVGGVLKRNKLKKVAAKTLCDFGVSFENENAKEKYINDMVNTYARYGFGFAEYLCLRFGEKSKTERLQFVADWEHLGYACTLNNHKNDELFDNKWKTYGKFKEFYGREVVFFDNENQFEQFKEFVSSHLKFIIKPLDLSCGRGIQIIKSEDYDWTKEKFVSMLTEYNGRFIMEELIVQVEEIAKLHPASVNTVRVPTVRMDDETLIITPFFRVGQNGKHVDNGGAGGIICAVNAETGCVFGAADENGNTFTTHPQTQEQLIGFQLPRWDEAKNLVKQLVNVIPDNRYTGWDLALTDSGWVLVEANRRGQFLWQIPSQIGFRSEINSILKKLGKKY
ncbi:MAG: hypothetical protein IJW15_00275 [Clostridia bacterium]|nr:hypothetical protein [Clostridia bacterium]